MQHGDRLIRKHPRPRTTPATLADIQEGKVSLQPHKSGSSPSAPYMDDFHLPKDLPSCLHKPW